MLVNLAANAFLPFRFRRLFAGMAVDRRIAREDSVNQFLRLMDTIGNLHLEHLFPIESRHLNILIRRDDNPLGIRNFLPGQNILGAARAVCFRLQRSAQLRRLLLQRFRGHEGVGNAGGAGGNRQNPVAFLFFRPGRRGKTLGFFLIDGGEKFFRRFCLPEPGAQRFIHQQRHQPGEHFQVHISVFRGGNHKQDIRGLAIGRVVIHAARNGDGGKRRFFYRAALGMRNRNAVSHRCCAEGFPFENFFPVAGNVAQVPRPLMQPDQPVDCLLPALRLCVQHHTFWGQ